MKRTEAMIQKAILDYLGMVYDGPPIYFFRAGVANVETESGRRFKTGKIGLADIVVCKPIPIESILTTINIAKKTGATMPIFGQFTGVEVKTAKGRQSKVQRQAESDIKLAGGEYYVVRSVSDVRKIMEV